MSSSMFLSIHDLIFRTSSCQEATKAPPSQKDNTSSGGASLDICCDYIAPIMLMARAQRGVGWWKWCLRAIWGAICTGRHVNLHKTVSGLNRKWSSRMIKCNYSIIHLLHKIDESFLSAPCSILNHEKIHNSVRQYCCKAVFRFQSNKPKDCSITYSCGKFQ